MFVAKSLKGWLFLSIERGPTWRGAFFCNHVKRTLKPKLYVVDSSR